MVVVYYKKMAVAPLGTGQTRAPLPGMVGSFFFEDPLAPNCTETDARVAADCSLWAPGSGLSWTSGGASMQPHSPLPQLALAPTPPQPSAAPSGTGNPTSTAAKPLPSKAVTPPAAPPYPRCFHLCKEDLSRTRWGLRF